MAPTRWQDGRSEADSRAYVRHFEKLAADGADLDGEARFVDALLPRGSRVLDAGCGTARLGAELARRGHRVTAVDLDPVLVAAAAPVPGLQVQVGDLTELVLDGEPFDAAVAAGNVFVFMAPGTEAAALQRIAALLRPGGLLVTGFATDRHYTLAQFDADADAAGLELQHRFGTWDLLPFRPGGDWAVTVLHRRT